MKKMMKHLYAILLVVVLIATLLPTSIFAAPGKGKGRGKNKQEKITETVMETEPTETVLDETVSEETAQEDSLKIETPAEAPVEDASVEETIEDVSTEEMAEEIPAEEPVVEETVVEEALEETFDAITVENMAVKGSDDLLVSIYAPEGAFKTGTTVVAKVVPIETVQAAVDSTEEVNGTVLAAVDITFMLDGVEQQPANGLQVSVSITAKNVIAEVEASELEVVHIDSVTEDVNSVDEIDVNNEEETVSFEADTFSVYALIGTAVIEEEEGSFEFETDSYKIVVSYTKEAKIPAGTELVVNEILPGSDEYDELWDQTLSKINENATWEEGSEVAPDTRKSIASAAFFDISLMSNGNEFEPEVPLQVEITLKDGGLPLFDGQEAKVVHFGSSTKNGGNGTELIEDIQLGNSGSLANGMPEGVSVDSFKYEQLGFSPVAVVTTDDYINFDAAEYVPEMGNVNALAASLMAAGLRAAGDPTINAGKTVTDNDGDGIYELALSVNATSQQSSETDVTKSNVVMVIDVSGSMGNNDSWIYYDTYTYDASTYEDFRYYSSSTSRSTRLYYGDYYRYESNWYGGGEWVYAGTGWYSGNAYGGTAYSGTVYAYETRLHATQRAACAVVDALLKYNENDYGITDVFEITVVKFADLTASGDYNGTETVIRDSTSGTAIKNAINNLNSGGGTNWEAALNLAKTEADYFKNTDNSTDSEKPEINSVIFLTDGFPTHYVKNNRTQGGSGKEDADNIETSYTEARPSARAIVSGGYNLYNIFAFGSDTKTFNNHTGFDYLRALTNYAYGTGNSDNYGETDKTRQYAFNAKSTDDLVKAFETIIKHMTNSVGYAGVNLTDGVSLGATSTSVAINGTAKAESMRYTVKDDTDKLSYSVNISKNKAATFTIYNADGTETTLTDDAPETVPININGTTITSQVYSVTVGSGENAKTYKISPATIDADTGMVKWNLAGLGILENGYTYTVAFDVWPNQLSYDICADLNNGIYATVDAALDAYGITDATEQQHIKDAIVHNADGSYSLYTNYSQEIEYYPATSHTDNEGNVTWDYGEKTTQDLPHPDPLPLKGSLLPMSKVWESDLAISELNEILWEDGIVDGKSKEYQITLYLWKADTVKELEELYKAGDTSKAYVTKILGWDADEGKYIFEKDSAVAPGTMVNLAEAEKLGFDITDTSKIKTFTNDEGTTLQYYVIENGHYYYVTESGSDLHFELETILYHPMIVDGTLYNVAFGEGQTVEHMDPMYGVVATNTLKGGLNISKVVSTTQIAVEDGKIKNVTQPVDAKGIKTVTDEFTYEIQIWKEDENGAKSAVYTFDDQIKNGETMPGSVGYRVFSKPKIGDDGKLAYDSQLRGAILTKDSPNASLANGIFATIANNVTTITLTMPANGEIRLVNLPAGTKYTVKEIVDEAGSYTYAATKSQVKKSDTEITEGTVSTGNVVTGSVAGNTASIETYYNWAANFYVYHSATNTIEKISFADDRVEGTYDTKEGAYTYKFNIVNETAEKCIYGGYYQAYGKQFATDDQITGKATEGALTFKENKELEFVTEYDGTHTGGFWANDDGASVYGGDQTSWAKDKAYEVNGTKMTPTADTVYYLKEVPDVYLEPAAYTVYDTVDTDADGYFQIKKLYQMTATDDGNYKQVGFDVTTSSGINDSGTYTADYCWGEKIFIKKDGVDLPALTATDIVSGHTGYIAAREINNYIKKNAYYREIPYHVTLDNVKVTSVKRLIVYVRNTRWKDWTKPGMTKVAGKVSPAYAALKGE